jgi:hypothetical protein
VLFELSAEIVVVGFSVTGKAIAEIINRADRVIFGTKLRTASGPWFVSVKACSLWVLCPE